MNTTDGRPHSFLESILLLWEAFRYRPPYRIQRVLTFGGAAALLIAVLLTRYLSSSVYQSDAFVAASILCIFGPFALLGLVSIIYRSFFIAWRELRGTSAIILGAIQLISFSAFILWAFARLLATDYP